MKASTLVKGVFYISVCGILAFAISNRIEIVKSQRAISIPSMDREYSVNGLPISVMTVAKDQSTFIQKVTVRPLKGRKMQALVDGKSKEYISINNQVKLYHGDEAYHGRVVSIASKVQFESGLFPITIRVTDKIDSDAAWFPADILVGLPKSGISIPTENLFEEEGISYVWQVRDGKLAKKKVVAKHSDGYTTVVVAGLKAGDQVVSSKSERLKEGAAVRIYAEKGVVR